MTIARDALVLLERRYRLLARQPVWIAVMLVQPLVWLLLYSRLFGRLPELARTGGGSYLEFLTPGVVVLSAFSHGAWEGTTTVRDIEQGTFERFLVTPLARAAPLIAQLAQAGLTGAAQGVIVLLAAAAVGVRINAGAVGWVVVLAAAALTAAIFAGISHALALLLRREETVIAVGQFTVLPLTFASVTLVTASLMPAWLRAAAAANPLSWAVDAARAVTLPGTDWTAVGLRVGALTLLAALTGSAALAAFGRYRQSL